MKKHWLLALLVIVLLALPLLAACGGTEETTTTAPPATTATTAPPATTATTGGTAPSETTAPPTTLGEPMTLLVGGTFALTGAYAEDCAAVLAGMEDYVKYVNDNKVIAPWYTDRVIPANLTFELKWGDDALAPDKALTIYEDQKSAGMLVNRITGSPEGMAMKDLLIADNIGATSQSMSPAYLVPPGNIFTTAPIYTDQMAAIATWFLKNWTDTSRKPRIAWLTADSTLGRNIDVPELVAYMEQLGFEFVGAQYVPMVPTAPPTTQLAWLKDNKVDLAVGVMINPGSQPTIKEAERLGMGPDLEYKITFGFANPAHLHIFIKGMGTAGNGLVVSGDVCAQDADVDGIKFADMLQETYRPTNKNGNVMYLDGLIEGMMQVEALRLAYLAVGPEMTSEDVLKQGFWQLKDFSVGDLTITPLTFGEGDPQGLDQVRLQQAQNGKIVEIGSEPIANIIPAPK
jgi:ABC-type branched-subunit amino acid transport system substrate-binding protein